LTAWHTWASAAWGAKQQPFGFRWFIPELIKHKNIWRDILLASLLLQLIGLATPLFTQVVIDKVVVHQSQSTLIVIGVGMLIFLGVMFWYSWQLSLISVGMLGLIAFISLLVTPVFRDRLNKQFLLGARNQAFVTEYVSGMSTVKSLQMEPVQEYFFSPVSKAFQEAGRER
jgi:subfamily B ATP-binding cassette protein HlyB/CyaB